MNPARLTGYEVMRGPHGDVLQSAVRSRPAHHTHDASNAGGWITRAVVLTTYYPEEDDRSGWTKGHQRAQLADVRTYGAYSRVLSKVPVLQSTHGLWDEDVRTLRGSSINLAGGSLQGAPGRRTGPTAAENLDGDHVLVGFLDNDPRQPVILPFALAHPKANNSLKKADGRVRRIRHNGSLFQIDKDGNLSLDGRGAAKEELGPNGAEVSNSGTGGKVTLLTSNGSKTTSIHLDNAGRVFIGGVPGAANEPAVLGTQLSQVLNELIDAILALQVGTAVGPSSPPMNAAQFLAVKQKILQKLILSDFIFVQKAA